LYVFFFFFLLYVRTFFFVARAQGRRAGEREATSCSVLMSL
jgi:hypothetical protein